MDRRKFQRALAASVLTLSGITATKPAFAGSYLSRAALLLEGAELEARKLRARFHDKELAPKRTRHNCRTLPSKDQSGDTLAQRSCTNYPVHRSCHMNRRSPSPTHLLGLQECMHETVQ